METTAEFTAENQMLFFNLYSTTFQWFSFHSWINNLFYVLSIHWKILILMNIVFLLSICYEVVLTQTMTLVYKDSLTLTYPPNTNI